MRLPGLLLILIAVLIPLYWFTELSREWDILPLFSQYLGIAALIMMGIIFLLATRFRILETIFGGLDRIYVLHKWLGIGALVVVFFHDRIDAELDGTTGFWLSDFGESLGGTSFDMLQILLLITLITLIPYHWWRWSHKLMGVLYICGVGHFALIDKPYSNLSPLALYTFTFCAVGILCYFYTLFPEKWFRHRYSYKVTAIQETGGATSVSLAPIGKAMKHSAGQFAFIEFDEPKFKEIHPFTASSAPKQDGTLRFSIKNLGDYTQQLPNNISQNTEVKVQGPFGHFRHRKNSQSQVWIAAGIGITPFLAWAQDLEKNNNQTIHWFYCIRNDQQAPHLEEAKQLAQNIDNLHLHVIESTAGKRLSTQMIMDAVTNDWPKIRVSFCGPEKMRESLKKELTTQGLRRSRFHYEEFEIRSGIGLDRLILWVAPKVMPWVQAHIWPRLQRTIQRFRNT